MKNSTEVTLKISSNVVGDSNDEHKFSHKLLLTNMKISKLRKAFTNGLSVNITVTDAANYKKNVWIRFSNINNFE